ncbi:MAG: hypothetical protein JXB47_20895 [Anaerolineae bacterium]|nr:hypothetical protein [Anaerolineae bacterium]
MTGPYYSGLVWRRLAGDGAGVQSCEAGRMTGPYYSGLVWGAGRIA